MIHDVIEKVKQKDLDGAIDDLIRIAEIANSVKAQNLAIAETYHIEYLKSVPPEIKESVAQDVAARLQFLEDTRFGAKGGIKSSKLDPLTKRSLTKSFALLELDKKRLIKKASMVDRHRQPNDFGIAKPSRITLEEFK